MESNKLIAEFMGGILSSVPNLINLPQTIGESRILCVKGSEGLPNGTYEVKRIIDLKYHSSWDWLMPVVEKIERLNYDFQIGGGIGVARIVDVGLDRTEVMREIEVSYPTKLEATYNAVVEFINQLNN